jgi:hypothetical protein
LRFPKARLSKDILVIDSRSWWQQIFHSKIFPYRGERSLKIKTPKSQKVKSTIVVDIEGSYVVTDHGDLRSCVDAGKEI